jgi:hypothetical protein
VMTRITVGLRIGQQVVLANLGQPLPDTNPLAVVLASGVSSCSAAGPSTSWRRADPGRTRTAQRRGSGCGLESPYVILIT